VDGIDFFFRCRLNDIINVQITFAAQRRSNVDGFICIFDMQGVFIRILKNSDGFDSHFFACTDYPDGDFSPVGD
jgi:hypothetical protein